MAKRILVYILLLVVVTLTAPAWADALDDCADKLRFTGAPHWTGAPPRHAELCRTGFLVSHDADHKVPGWVLEDLTPDRLDGAAERRHAHFRPDPELPKTDRARLSDYKGSHYDRGHMAPAADMRSDEAAMSQSFYLSNVAPQVGIGLNRGIWSRLEDRVRAWARSRPHLIVITGPLFDRQPALIGDGVAVPAAFYKIIYDPARAAALAFRMPNRPLPGAAATLPGYLVPVAAIEADAGIAFFPALPEPARRRLVEAQGEMWD